MVPEVYPINHPKPVIIISEVVVRDGSKGGGGGAELVKS